LSYGLWAKDKSKKPDARTQRRKEKKTQKPIAGTQSDRGENRAKQPIKSVNAKAQGREGAKKEKQKA
jgi:hypothetical protein